MGRYTGGFFFYQIFNFLNFSSAYEKTDVESFMEDNNEENTVPTHNRRKGKKLMAALVKKKPLIETEDEESYEDPKDATHTFTAAAAHFVSDPSNIKTHPHYQGRCKR